MKQHVKWIWIVATLFGFGGCTTTKINLYEYKDVSSVSVVDENKAGYRINRPTLDSTIMVQTNGWREFDTLLNDYFLAYNSQRKVFDVVPGGTHQLRLALHDISSTQTYTPPRYVERKRKVKVKVAQTPASKPDPRKGGKENDTKNVQPSVKEKIIIQDESYYTTPYWTYRIDTSAVAELSLPGGERKYFESSRGISYSIDGMYPVEIPRGRYVQVIQDALDELQRQIANTVAVEGLVVSKKVAIDDEDDHIFMINMGTSDGLWEGQTMQMFKEIVQKDEIEGSTHTDKIRIGTARVSNQIMPNRAWIIMNDEDMNPLIEVGDIVRPMY